MFQIFRRCVLRYVTYVTVRYVTIRTHRHVRINGMLRYIAVSYVSLRYVRVENRHYADGTMHGVAGLQIT